MITHDTTVAAQAKRRITLRDGRIAGDTAAFAAESPAEATVAALTTEGEACSPS